MTKKSDAPAIRFKGFSDAWEQRKVGTLIEDYTEKTVTQNQYPVLTSSQQQGIVLQEDYFADRQVTTDNNVGYYVLPKGYFTYRSRSDTDVFVFNRNNIVDKGIISYYYPVFAPKSCDSNFLLRRLNHGIKKQLSMAAEGTGQKVLAHAKFKNMVVDVPSQSEQEKIGTILEELDTLITLHQRQPFLHSTPEISLTVQLIHPFYTSSWEQRKFEEIAVRSSVICSDDTLPRVEYEDIVSGTGRLNKDIYAKQSIKSGIAFHQGDVLYGKLRPYLQNWLLPTFDGLAVGDFWVLQPQNADSSFLYRLIQSRQFDEVANQSTGTKMPRADWKLVSKTVFSIPSNISEQAAIGTYFTALDSLITLHQRKFEKLTNVK